MQSLDSKQFITCEITSSFDINFHKNDAMMFCANLPQGVNVGMDSFSLNLHSQRYPFSIINNHDLFNDKEQ